VPGRAPNAARNTYSHYQLISTTTLALVYATDPALVTLPHSRTVLQVRPKGPEEAKTASKYCQLDSQCDQAWRHHNSSVTLFHSPALLLSFSLERQRGFAYADDWNCPRLAKPMDFQPGGVP
jgi:hypothetical protein